MIEFNNQEDKNIWSCLEDFDFSEFPDVSKLRIELYLSVMKSIGTCGRCVYYKKDESFCSLLSTKTASFERCSDFTPVEQEDESAFEIMSEEFRREQDNLNNFSKIRKYQRQPRRPHKEDKLDVKKDKE